MSTITSPLVEAGGQFPQGAGNFQQPGDDGAPSTVGDRPFGLRFAQRRPMPGEYAATLPPSRYCPDRQINLDPATGAPWRHSMGGTGSMETTGPSTDGGPSTGGEEWKPDFTGDMP